ncbi:DUF6455 family protein [Lutimaribacter marinistellae]|uniref:DUF6455 family protein n=1 Tax=Lutimaribacter marinistellae TaxID=1820329 RepID=A0ABV7TGX0_9RHOB
MRPLGSLMHHLRLVMRMAKSTGTDLVDAYDDGRLSQDEWAHMVQTCRGCQWSERCPGWLDEHEIAATVPATCPNRARFAALKAGQEMRQ